MLMTCLEGNALGKWHNVACAYSPARKTEWHTFCGKLENVDSSYFYFVNNNGMYMVKQNSVEYIMALPEHEQKQLEEEYKCATT